MDISRLLSLQDSIYGEGNKGPLTAHLKRKADDKQTQDLDVKVRLSFLTCLKTVAPLSLLHLNFIPLSHPIFNATNILSKVTMIPNGSS